jgi:hypothetical protein
MTRTIQPCSWAYLSEAEKNLTLIKPETEDNVMLLLSVFDSLNKLCEKLNRLNYIIQRKNIEQILCQKYKEEQNED